MLRMMSEEELAKAKEKAKRWFEADCIKRDKPDLLELWKRCPVCKEIGEVDEDTANVTCINPNCERYGKVVR